MDFYKDEQNDIFATRKQIGECLNYSDPQKAIDKIHERRKDRLDKFSVTVSLGELIINIIIPLYIALVGLRKYADGLEQTMQMNF